MALSYSDLNFNNGQYIPQYAGIPLDEIRNTGETLANRHYTNIANANSLQILQNQMKSQALEGAKPYFDAHITAVDQALQEMAKNGGENSTARINALATAFQGDQGILHAMQRSKEASSIQEQINKVTTETGRDAVYHKQRLEDLKKASVMVSNPDGSQSLNPLYSSQFNLPVSPYLDPTIDYKRITDEIKPDAWMSQGLQGEDLIKFQKKQYQLANGEIDLPKFVSYMKSAGIPESKIKALEDKMFQAYKNTKSYEQHKEYFNRSDDTAKQDLYNYAQLGKYRQDEKHYTQVSASGAEGKGEEPQIPLGNKVLDPAVIGEKIRTPMPWDLSLQGGQLKYDKLKIGNVNLGTAPYSRLDLTQQTDQEKKIANENFSKALTAAKEAMPQEAQKGLDDKGVVKKFFNDFYKSELSNAYASTVDKKTGLAVDDAIQRNPQSWNYYDEDGTLVPYGSDDWIKLTGGDATKFAYGNTLNPYNLRATIANEDAAATAMHTVNAPPSAKKEAGKTFYVSNPAAINENPVRTNATILYGKLSSQPGQWLDNADGTKTKILVGNQKEQAWETHKEHFLQATQGDENKAKALFYQMRPMVETLLPDGTVKLGTPATVGADLYQSGNILSFKK